MLVFILIRNSEKSFFCLFRMNLIIIKELLASGTKVAFLVQILCFNLWSSFATFKYFLPIRPEWTRKWRPLNTEGSLKDTVNDSASLDVALLAEMQPDKLPKAAGVVVVDRLGVPEGLHDGTAAWRTSRMINRKTKNTSPAIEVHNNYLLSSSASSTCDVPSLDETSRECWLMQDRNFRISLVLSVFPAPLSPLRGTKNTRGKTTNPL